MKNSHTFITVLATLLATTIVVAQWNEKPLTGSSESQLPDRTNMSGMSGLAPELKAELIDPHENARKKQAVVRAEVWGVDVVSQQAPADSGQATLVYTLDHDAPIKTDQKEYTFNNIAAGRHTITIQLIGSAGQAVAPDVRLRVNVPK